MARYPRRKYARKPRKGKAPRRKYAKRVYRKKSFALKVKQVMHRLAENKNQVIPQLNNAINFASTSVSPSFISLTPTPLQGTTQQQRIGNQINVVKSSVKGFVNLLPYNAVTNQLFSPVKVKMWLVSRQRSNRQISGQPILQDWNNFFMQGSTSLGFQSNLLDIMLPVNKDYWICHAYRQVELSYTIGGINPSSAGILMNPSGKVSVPFNFDITRHLKTLKYNDDGLYPTNKELYLVFQAVRADGQGDPVNTQLAEFHYITDHRYEDM